MDRVKLSSTFGARHDAPAPALSGSESAIFCGPERLVGTWDVAEVGGVPSRLERLAAGSHDQQRRAWVHGSGATSNGGVGDCEHAAPVELNLLAVDLKDRSSFEGEVQLLLAARLLVVIFDQQLVRTSCDKDVDS